MIPAGWRRGIEIAILVLIAFYAGFAAWRDEHDARINAERKLAEKPIYLARVLAYDDIGVAIRENNNTNTVGTFTGRISNVGQDTINLHVENVSLFIDDREITNGSIGGWTYIPPGHGMPLSTWFLTKETVIPEGAKLMTLELRLKYDTAAPTGMRESYRKYSFPLMWSGGHVSTNGYSLVEERED
jgi:hypothetical protein